MTLKQVYFHVGLGKTGSTYLQTKFFPKLRGIKYIPPNQYRKSKRIIQRSHEQKFLVSREFDQQLEEELDWFLKDFPDAKVIIFFRQHHEWIASQYRRYVKNGWSDSFEDFIDLENDLGYWKRTQLLYMPMLEMVQYKTKSQPCVILYDEFKADPFLAFQKIAQFTQSEFNIEAISLRPVHQSYSDKRLLKLQGFCKMSRLPFARQYQKRWRNWLFFRPWWFLYHAILFLSPLLPDRILDKKELVDHSYLSRIKEHFSRDWSQISNRIK